MSQLTLRRQFIFVILCSVCIGVWCFPQGGDDGEAPPSVPNMDPKMVKKLPSMQVGKRHLPMNPKMGANMQASNPASSSSSGTQPIKQLSASKTNNDSPLQKEGSNTAKKKYKVSAPIEENDGQTNVRHVENKENKTKESDEGKKEHQVPSSGEEEENGEPESKKGEEKKRETKDNRPNEGTDAIQPGSGASQNVKKLHSSLGSNLTLPIKNNKESEKNKPKSGEPSVSKMQGNARNETNTKNMKLKGEKKEVERKRPQSNDEKKGPSKSNSGNQARKNTQAEVKDNQKNDNETEKRHKPDEIKNRNRIRDPKKEENKKDKQNDSQKRNGKHEEKNKDPKKTRKSEGKSGSEIDEGEGPGLGFKEPGKDDKSFKGTGKDDKSFKRPGKDDKSFKGTGKDDNSQEEANRHVHGGTETEEDENKTNGKKQKPKDNNKGIDQQKPNDEGKETKGREQKGKNDPSSLSRKPWRNQLLVSGQEGDTFNIKNPVDQSKSGTYFEKKPRRSDRYSRGGAETDGAGSSSHFIVYGTVGLILLIVLYVVYQKRQKILALIVEGRRRGASGSGERSRRGSGNVAYRPLPSKETDDAAARPESLQKYIY